MCAVLPLEVRAIFNIPHKDLWKIESGKNLTVTHSPLFIVAADSLTLMLATPSLTKTLFNWGSTHKKVKTFHESGHALAPLLPKQGREEFEDFIVKELKLLAVDLSQVSVGNAVLVPNLKCLMWPEFGPTSLRIQEEGAVRILNKILGCKK